MLARAKMLAGGKQSSKPCKVMFVLVADANWLGYIAKQLDASGRPLFSLFLLPPSGSGRQAFG
jgi:hypothetical protein